MKHIPKISRYLLGLMFFVFGAAGLFNLMPQPTDIPEALANFSKAMADTGYFFQVLKATEMVCGFLLLAGIAPALALVILAPITIQIFLIHFFLTPGPQNLVLPVIIIVLQLLAAKGYWSLYSPLFRRNKNI